MRRSMLAVLLIAVTLSGCAERGAESAAPAITPTDSSRFAVPGGGAGIA